MNAWDAFAQAIPAKANDLVPAIGLSFAHDAGDGDHAQPALHRPVGVRPAAGVPAAAVGPEHARGGDGQLALAVPG